MNTQIANTLLSGSDTILARRQRAVRQTTLIIAVVVFATFTVGMASASFIA